VSKIATPIGLHGVAGLRPGFAGGDSFELAECPGGLESRMHVRLVCLQGRCLGICSATYGSGVMAEKLSLRKTIRAKTTSAGP